MESIFKHKTDSGTFIVRVSLSIDTWALRDEFKYNIFTQFIPTGKRKPESGMDCTDKLPEGLATKAKLAFWELIKPKD